MVTRGRDREFRFPQVSFIDYKHIEIDRTLINLFPRLKFNGYMGRVKKQALQLTIEAFQAELVDEKNGNVFVGFSEHPEIVGKWLETDLLDLVNRGRPKQAFVSPRPLHGNIYKFRNADHSRDYNSSEQIYWMLDYAHRGQDVLRELKKFLFPDMDWNRDHVHISSKIDVETQVILHFDSQVRGDAPDMTRNQERYPPLCMHLANLFAEDVLRLLAYENYVPRSVLVDYLKTLFAFHLALYHLHIFKLLPEVVKRFRSPQLCQVKGCPLSGARTAQQGQCTQSAGLVVEMGDADNQQMIELARRSADAHYRRIPTFIQAQYTVKNLDDMVQYLCNERRKLSKPQKGYFSIVEILAYLKEDQKLEREKYFGQRLQEWLQKNKEESQDGTVAPEVQRILEMGLDEFETFIEIIMANRVQFHRRYITDCIDSLLLKNRDTGLLRQTRTKDRARYFSMGSRLLEVLLQIVVLEPQGTTFATRELRIDDLLALLRERYGLYIDRLPQGDGFEKASVTDLQALQRNKEAFKMRLREIGFFQDLSDAYITQTITPRYTITPPSAPKKPLGGKR